MKFVLPGGIDDVYDYAKQGAGQGVIVIPMTLEGNMALVRKQSHPLATSFWEFPRSSAAAASDTSEAERCLFEDTGLNAKCRLITNIAPESSTLNMVYGVYLAFVADDVVTGVAPELVSNGFSDPRWFTEDEMIEQIKNSLTIDSLTLAALAVHSVYE